MKHLVQFSTGAASAEVAWRVVAEHGPEDVVLLTGGGCVRGGQAQWSLLLQVNRSRYLEWEADEEASREMLGKDVSILRDRTGGTTSPLSLRSFRERIEQQPSMFDGDDWGACGCDMDGDAGSAGTRVRVPKVERWDGGGWVALAREAA